MSLTTLAALIQSNYIQKTDPNTLLTNVLNITYFFAGTVAVLVIIGAGFLYVTSTGDAGRITKAKNAILYAVIGLVAVMLAFVITAYVRTAL